MSGPRTFVARYPGRCVGCDEWIEVGDLLTYDEDGMVIHADCATSVRAAKIRPTQICRRCFMEKAANGTCGCD